LRTVRYTDADLEVISNSGNFYTFAFTLEDKFGDNGLICVIILKEMEERRLFIDTWLMSCRVLKRGMEHFVLNTISDFAGKLGFESLVGEFLPTLKNEMVRKHYMDLGFVSSDNLWFLDVKGYNNKTTYINKK